MSDNVNQMSERELRAWASDYKADDLLALSHRCKEEGLLSPNDRQFLYSIGKRLQKQNLTPFQLRRLKRIVDKLSAPDDHEVSSEEVNAIPTTHLTIRMAWHDSGWNGRICRNPAENIYCVGQHSLLSKRLRERRDTELESKLAGRPLDDPELGDYIPPCFWSINANGERTYGVSHDNPAAPNFPKIEEKLPDHSVFTWPFKLSFVKDQQQYNTYGRYYPEKLFHGRINRFRNGIADYESIAFLYTNYDNPISGDLQQYLVMGAAFISDQGEPRYFDPDNDELERIRKKKDAKNFPLLNWALRYSLDLESEGFLLPYEPYLRNGVEIDPQYQELLEEVRVVISEPELIQSFKYVSMPIGDDTAIMLLAKIRKSLLLMLRQAVVAEDDVRERLSICEEMLRACLERRTHFPGFASLVRAVLGMSAVEHLHLDNLVTEVRTTYDQQYGDVLVRILEDEEGDTWPLKTQLNEVLGAVKQRLGQLSLSPEAFVRVSMLNLTDVQFSRILNSNDLPSLSRLSENPYLITEEYPEEDMIEDERLGYRIDGRIGMHNVDIAFLPPIGLTPRLPRFQDILPSDPRRVRPLILKHLLEEKNYGHCYSESRRIERALPSYPLSFGASVKDIVPTSLRGIDDAFASHLHQKIRWTDDGDHRFFYLLEVQRAEEQVRSVVKEYINLPDIDANDEAFFEYIHRSVEQLKTSRGGDFDSDEFVHERRRLYENVLRRRLSIIAGGPGTGKSYELLRIFRILRDKGENVVLLAPTGKATQRLKADNSFGKVNAKTIAKFLSENEQQDTFTASNLNVMVDECSMVDLMTLDELLRKFDAPRQKIKRIILIGDRFQLPPIGFGKPFFDIADHLIESKIDDRHLSEIKVNCRQVDGGVISRVAAVFGDDPKHFEPTLQALIKGQGQEPSVTVDYWREKDELFDMVDSRISEAFDVPRCELDNSPSKAMDRVLGLNSNSESGGTQFNADSFQIISPYRTTYSGTSGVNHRFQSKYRAENRGGKQVGDVFLRVNDKLVVTKNSYNKGQLVLANGEMGILKENGNLSTGTGETYDLKELSTENVELGYALTVHKAQGSGFDHVFVVIPNRRGLLSRELLYTAMSRAKQGLHLFIEKQENVSENEHLLNIARQTSFVLRRNTSLFKLPAVGYTYIPEDGVRVKSRVEYIIYRKLEELKRLREDFSFEYERPYTTPYSFDIHPDFCIELSDGTTYFWEHLGRTKDRHYVRDWYERRKIYEQMGDLENVITTDEESGIVDKKIENIMEQILAGGIGTEVSGSSYSTHHFSLVSRNIQTA